MGIGVAETAAGRPVPGCGDPLVKREHPKDQKAEERRHEDCGIGTRKEICGVHGMPLCRDKPDETFLISMKRSSARIGNSLDSEVTGYRK
jgi:hypothetical protein